jgi:hypothetical protein
MYSRGVISLPFVILEFRRLSIQPAIDLPMLEFWNGNDVVWRLDPLFGNAILSRPPLDDVTGQLAEG